MSFETSTFTFNMNQTAMQKKAAKTPSSPSQSSPCSVPVFNDATNRQPYLTPRWRERSSSVGSVEPPMLSGEERSLTFFELPVLSTPASRQSLLTGPLPFLPFGMDDMEDESMPSLGPAVRLAPRYGHPGDFPF
jgi:hypothetical protein